MLYEYHGFCIYVIDKTTIVFPLTPQMIRTFIWDCSTDEEKEKFINEFDEEKEEHLMNVFPYFGDL